MCYLPVLITDGISMHGSGHGGNGPFAAMTTFYTGGLVPTASPFASGKFETNQLQSAGRVRTEFPETWLWNNASVGYVTVNLNL